MPGFVLIGTPPLGDKSKKNQTIYQVELVHLHNLPQTVFDAASA